MSNNQAPVSKGQIIEIKISGISHEGQGIGRYENFAIFVPGPLMGEKVKAIVTEVNKSYAKADLLDILEESAVRVTPRCRIFDICGGCQLQHALYEEQLVIKCQIVENALKRIGKFQDVDVLPVIGMENPWNYRNRIQLHFQFINGQIELGFFRKETNQLAALDNCYLIPDIFNQIVYFIKTQLNKLIADEEDFKKIGLSHLVIQKSQDTGEIALVFVTANGKDMRISDLALAVVTEYPQVVSVVRNDNLEILENIFGTKWQHLWGKRKLVDRVGGNIFSVSAGSFVQVNPQQTELLYKAVLKYAGLKKAETAIDVYSGIGTISLLLAGYCDKVYGIEEVSKAIDDANENAIQNGIENIEFMLGKAEELLPGMEEAGIKADLVVVDPPRKGCDIKALEAITAIGPSRIVYVSCDPGTMARDLRILSNNGYEIKEVQPVDMFPQTSHVECVLSMVRC